MENVLWTLLGAFIGAFIYPAIQNRERIKRVLVQQLMHPEIHARSTRYAYMRAFLSAMDELDSVAVLEHPDRECRYRGVSPLVMMTRPFWPKGVANSNRWTSDDFLWNGIWQTAIDRGYISANGYTMHDALSDESYPIWSQMYVFTITDAGRNWISRNRLTPLRPPGSAIRAKIQSAENHYGAVVRFCRCHAGSEPDDGTAVAPTRGMGYGVPPDRPRGGLNLVTNSVPNRSFFRDEVERHLYAGFLGKQRNRKQF